MRVILKRFLLICGGILLGLVLLAISLEIFFRIKYPNSTFHSATRFTWMSNLSYESSFKRSWTIDPIVGFRPIFGTPWFNKYGTATNTYSINKQPGVERLLFIGDSVTAYNYIISGLQKRYGDTSFEYWNAGIGSYNTAQEVKYYETYNAAIHPDEVILTFVYNDFDITPMVFFNASDDLMVYSPKVEIHNLSPFLFKNSYLYRLYIGYTTSRSTYKYQDNTEVENSLRELQSVLKKDNIKFTVIISPFLIPAEKFTGYEKGLHSKILSILNKLQIRYFDLTYIIDDAMHAGVPLKDPTENDTIHPSQELGAYMGKYLYDHGIFVGSTIGKTLK